MKKILNIAFLLIVSLVFSGCKPLQNSPDTVDIPVMKEDIGHYEAYSRERFVQLQEKERFALFFHAPWCPTCRALEKNILADLTVFNGHTMLKADYDNETELKKEYDVIVQTTVILFDEDGYVAHKKLNPSLAEIRSFFN